MTKIYESDSDISINIVLPKGGNMYISFDPTSMGHSRYYTDNEEIQQGIENHYNFNNLFRLVEHQETTATNKATDKADESSKKYESPKVKEVEEIEMSDLGSAKDYLAEEYGYSRTSLRSQKAIFEAAAKEGIRFIIPE